jgi:capsular exopolysaccharide synthesis family protein
MGRVLDALTRAEQETSSGNQFFSATPVTRESVRPEFTPLPEAPIPTEWQNEFSGQSSARHPTSALTAASTARTDAVAGQALPGGSASRVVGATMDAAGSARAAGFVSQDINPARVEPHLLAITNPRSPYCEEYRSLRTHVIHANRSRRSQALVLTSAGVSEGKSLTALNLAWLLAQSDGVRALIIDADLRSPCLTNYLGIEARSGLSDLLTGAATLRQTVVRLEPSGLCLLPGGEARSDAAEMLSGPRFSQILTVARRMFDFIIIDAPPLGLFTDASLLIDRADSALVVVRSGKTHYSHLNRLLDTLPRERILGVVLNRNREPLAERESYYRREYRNDRGLAPAQEEMLALTDGQMESPEAAIQVEQVQA